MPAEIRGGDHILRELFTLVYSAHILETIDSGSVMTRSILVTSSQHANLPRSQCGDDLRRSGYGRATQRRGASPEMAPVVL